VTILGDAKDAVVGWLDIIAGRPGGGERFNATQAGLVRALIWYFLLVLLTVLVQGLSLGMPASSEVFTAVMVNALPLLGVYLVILVTVRLFRLAIPVNALLVPAIYAMAFILAIGLPLSLLGGGMFANAMLGALGYMFYRAGRDIAKLGIGVAIAFAVLSIVVLVALPIGLYMVFMPSTPAS
jgi:hypothetical protein